MALVTHQMQGMVTMELVFHQSFVRLSTHVCWNRENADCLMGSYVTLPSRPLPWIKGIKLKRYVTTVHMAARTDRPFLLKRNIYFRPKLKALQISAFKGSAQNGEPGGRASGSKTAKKSVKLKESEGAITESRDANEISLSYTSEANESVTSSPAIHRLFKKWLTNLRTQSSGEAVDGILEEEPSPREVSETELGTENSERSEILKAVWCHFVSLDATIKIPLLIFLPLYLAVNVLYGAEVSKELTPLWVAGPLIVALYVKMLRWIFSLYVWTFKQTVKIITNLPTYYSNLVQGKLKEEFRSRFWQPIVNIKNLNYKEFSKTKLKELQVWVVERYLDFVESIWPYYCRTIRFLKRANLI